LLRVFSYLRTLEGSFGSLVAIQTTGGVDEANAGDLADLGGGLHVDDALAAAGLEAVLFDVGTLAVAVLRDREA
jgi:hypothetical protein